MANPKVITGYEPSGSGWELVNDQVFTQGPPGTRVVAGYQDFSLLTLLGRSLIGNDVSMQELHDQLSSQGYWIYYMGGWNNPPGGPFGAGIDNYRITWLRKA